MTVLKTDVSSAKISKPDRLAVIQRDTQHTLVSTDSQQQIHRKSQ